MAKSKVAGESQVAPRLGLTSHNMSLFDLLGPDEAVSPPSSESWRSTNSTETTLGILDETLQSIYDVGQGRSGFSASSPSLLTNGSERADAWIPARTAVAVKHLPSSKSVSDLSDRLDQLTARRSQPSATPLEQTQCRDGDLEARNALRELGEELELLRAQSVPRSDSNNSPSTELAPMDIADLLMDKYLRLRLGRLPGTPFVLLARKKTQLKIDQLRAALEAKSAPNPATSSDNSIAAKKPADITTSSSSNNLVNAEWWQRVEQMMNLSPDKQEALRRLVTLPETQLRRLPAAQRELAAFAKRLDALVQLPDSQRQRLPVEHQRVLDELRRHREG